MIPTRLRRLFSIVLPILFLMLPIVSSLSRATPAVAQDDPVAEVSVVDFAFEPASLEVAAGTTVTWTNDGNRPHTVTADDGSFDSGRLDPGEQFSYRFDQPGTYTYHCGFHDQMTATVVVTEPSGEPLEVATPVAEEATATDDVGSPEGSAGASLNLAPGEPSRLAHIHAGNCEELGIVVYSLPNIRTYRIDEGDSGVGAIEMISGTANVPLTGLFGEPFSIHVHESAQNKQRYLACADVGGQPEAPWSEADGLFLEAGEQNDSGYSGFATLLPSAAGGTNVSIAIAASPDAVAAAEAQPAPAPSATYTSPSFGYAIGYGPTWRESENVSANGRDRFVLFNGKSYVTFTGTADYGDPQACVDAFVAQLTSDPNVSNLGPAVDENDNPLQRSTEATGISAIFNHDYTFPDRVEPYTLFVQCVPLVQNEGMLAIVQNVPTADFNTEVGLREALLRGVTLAQ